MSWQMASRRQAVVAWRDEQIVAAYRLFNAKGLEARAAFEKGLVRHAGFYDTLLDPVGFAEPRIDVELRRILPQALTRFLDDAAVSLADIAPEFAQLADALRRSHGLALPQARQFELTGAAGTVPSELTEPSSRQSELPDASSDRWQITKTIDRIAVSAGEAVRRGAGIVQKQAEIIADTLQDRTGLRDRVRVAAQMRMLSHWTGEAVEPRSVFSQLIHIIDSTTETARMSAL